MILFTSLGWLKKVVKLTGGKVVNMQLSRVKSEMVETTKTNSPAKSDVSCFLTLVPNVNKGS